MSIEAKKKDTISEHERGYLEGRRRTLINHLSHVLRELRGPDDDLGAARLILERQELVARLRGLCAKYGDNDWRDEDHLADVIDKNLESYLEERSRKRSR